MAPEVRSLEQRVRRQTDEMDAFIGALTEDAFQRRPAEERWSVAEHLAHLPLSTRPYLPLLEAALGTARERGWRSDAPSPGTRRGRFMIRQLEPPPRSRIRTFRAMQPPRQVDRLDALRDFRSCQEELRELLQGAGDLDLGRPRVRSPFFWPLKMSAFQAAEVAVVHTERHLWLMRETVTRVGSPSSPVQEAGR